HSDDDDDEGFCQPYRGIACARFIGNSTIYVDSLQQQGEIENQITAALTMIGTATQLSDRCSRFAIPSLCHYAFPSCDERSPVPRPRDLCRDECEALETDLCLAEYAVARSSHILLMALRLPNCDDLPPTGTPEAANCVRVGIPAAKPIDREKRCDIKTGVSSPSVGVTSAAAEWRVSHNSFTSIRGLHYLCQLPQKIQAASDCGKMRNSVKGDVGKSPKCQLPTPRENNKMEIVYILIPSLAVPALVALLFFLVCVCRNQRKSSAASPRSQAKPVARHDMELSLLTPHK
uniref:FZ domain-containing protein n=1 Tax=Petromyzon marinus TaxID=7757 RepID=S4RQ54_PETMA